VQGRRGRQQQMGVACGWRWWCLVQSAVRASTHNNADVRFNGKLLNRGSCSELRGRSGSKHGECVGRKRRVLVFVFVE